mmetsp:Transcript_1953/g.4422  ORF Transcript_1953/g.4422 Transcript_1953/m.4422 type:complete len:99 (-) Transcript_1953:55-351(-)
MSRAGIRATGTRTCTLQHAAESRRGCTRSTYRWSAADFAAPAFYDAILAIVHYGDPGDDFAFAFSRFFQLQLARFPLFATTWAFLYLVRTALPRFNFI